MVPRTEATSSNASWPAVKNLPSFTVNPVICPPAPGAPPRTPGSVCAKLALANINAANEIVIGPPGDTCGIHVSSLKFLEIAGFPYFSAKLQTETYHANEESINEKTCLRLA
jgi:hypothetical protein